MSNESFPPIKIFGLAIILICYTLNLSAQSKSGNWYIRQASKDYEKKNYQAALEKSMKGLNSMKLNKKRKKEGLFVLGRSFPIVVQSKLDVIQRTSRTALRKDFSEPYIVRNIINYRERLYTQYSELHSLNQQVKNLLLSLGEKIPSVQTKDYLEEIAESNTLLNQGKEQGASYFFELANEEANELPKKSPGKNLCRKVALYYKQAYQYDPLASFTAKAKEQYKIYRKLGTKRIGIAPFENKSSKDQYGAIAEQISDVITSKLFNDKSDLMEFTQIVSRDHIRQILEEAKYFEAKIINDSTGTKLKELYGIDELITGKITQINSFESDINRENLAITQRVKTGVKKVKKDDGKIKEESVYEDVSVPYTKMNQKAGAEIRGSYMIVKMGNAEVIRQRAFNKAFSYSETWANSKSKYITQVYSLKELLKETAPSPPHDTERVNLVAQKIIDHLMDEIVSYIQSQRM